MITLRHSQIIEHAKFTYSTLWKALEKPTKKQVGALKFLNLFNKIYKLKQFKSMLF